MLAVFLFSLFVVCSLSQSITQLNLSPGETVVVQHDGYPNLVNTWNSLPTQIFQIHQPNSQMDVLFVFDRFDVSYSDEFAVCNKDQSEQCDKSQECSCFLKLDGAVRTWQFSNGEPYLRYTARFPEYRENITDNYSRGGFRGTVMLIDPTKKTFFDCGSAVDLRNFTSPKFFVSQGYPDFTSMFDYCRVDMVAENGIRIRTLFVDNIEEADNFIIAGKNLTGVNVTYTIKDDNVGNTNYYFIDSASISFKITSGQQKYFILYAEPYKVHMPSCPFDPQVYSNKEFEILSPGYLESTNYPINLDCSWKMKDLPYDRQLLIEWKSIDLEQGADLLTADAFNYFTPYITNKMGNSLIFSKPNITGAEVKLTTDGLESLGGIRGLMHILDCSNSQAHFDMTSPKNVNLSIPANPMSMTFCRDVPYSYTFTTSKTQMFHIDFTTFEYPPGANLTIITDNETFMVLGKKPISLFNSSSYQINFICPSFTTLSADAGVAMKITTGPITRTKRPLCDNIDNIDGFTLSTHDVREYSVTSCKRNLGVYVFGSERGTGGVSLFDGSFDTGKQIDFTRGKLIILNGKELSIRATTDSVGTNDFRVVFSDSFVDNGGAVCGGALDLDAQNSTDFKLNVNFPCITTVFGTFDHITVPNVITMYSGFTFDAQQRIDFPIIYQPDVIDLFMMNTHHTLTFQPIKAANEVVTGRKRVNGSDATTILLEDVDFDHQLYSDSLMDDALQAWIQWQIDVSLATNSKTTGSKVYLQLLQVLAPGDRICVQNFEHCITSANGTATVQLPALSTLYYIYNRDYVNSSLVARVFATKGDVSTIAPLVTKTSPLPIASTTFASTMPPSSNVTAATTTGAAVSTGSTTSGFASTGSTPSISTTTSNPTTPSGAGNTLETMHILALVLVFKLFIGA